MPRKAGKPPFLRLVAAADCFSPSHCLDPSCSIAALAPALPVCISKPKASPCFCLMNPLVGWSIERLFSCAVIGQDAYGTLAKVFVPPLQVGWQNLKAMRPTYAERVSLELPHHDR